MFTDHTCLIIPNILGKSRADLFAKRLAENGGQGHIFNPKKKFDNMSSYTHIIVDPSLAHSQLEKILGMSMLSY